MEQQEGKPNGGPEWGMGMQFEEENSGKKQICCKQTRTMGGGGGKRV